MLTDFQVSHFKLPRTEKNPNTSQNLLETCLRITWSIYRAAFNLLRPNISMHILHTALYTFPKMLTRRIWLPIKSFFSKALLISSILMTIPSDSGGDLIRRI